MEKAYARNRTLLLAAISLWVLQGCGEDKPADRPPLVTSQSVQTSEEYPVQGLLQGSDPEARPIHFELHEGPAHGNVSVGIDGQFQYVPKTDYFGEDTFRFVAWDGKQYSQPATVHIAIANV